MMQISLRCLMHVVIMHVIVVAHVVVAVAVVVAVVVVITVGMVAHGVVAVVVVHVGRVHVPIMHWVGVAGCSITMVSPHVLHRWHVHGIPRQVPGTRLEPKRVL